jgi:orotate phosphoribosyltransferase
MLDRLDSATARARLLDLIREKAFRDGVEVTLASGKQSDFYVDGRKVTLHPEGLLLVSRLMLERLAPLGLDAIGGPTLGADPIAAGICTVSQLEERPLRAFLVRKEPKGHGMGAWIAGEVGRGDRVAVVEDTMTTGGSLRKAVARVEETGARVEKVLVIVDRLDPEGEQTRRELPFEALYTIRDLRGRN